MLEPIFVPFQTQAEGNSSCNIDRVDLFTIICADVSMTVLIICYLSLACLCIRIYWKIKKLQVICSQYIWGKILSDQNV